MVGAVSKRVVLFVTAFGSFLTPFMASAVNIAVPSIGSEFSMDAVLLTWVATSYLLAAAVFLVPVGKMADIYGMKKIFVYGLLIFTFSSLLLLLSSSSAMFLFLRIWQGVGAAMIFGTATAILATAYSIGDRGKALGILVASVYLGLSLGPFLGGLLTQNFGWRSIFIVAVPIGLVLLILTRWKLKCEWAEAKGERFDVKGSIIYGLSLASIIYGFSIIPDFLGFWLTIIGVLGVVGFIRWETRVKNPVLNVDLFRNNNVFLYSNLAALISYSATHAIAFLLSLYLQSIKGLNPEDAGLILLSQPIVQAIFSPVAGKLSDRIEPQKIASTGMALTVVGLSLFSFLNEMTTLQFVVVGLVIVGFGFALFSSPNTNAIMCSVQKRFYGVASGTLGTMRLTGQMLSMGIAMVVFAMFIGRAQIVPDNYPLFLAGVRTSFVIFAVLCFVGIFASIARGKVRKYPDG